MTAGAYYFTESKRERAKEKRDLIRDIYLTPKKSRLELRSLSKKLLDESFVKQEKKVLLMGGKKSVEDLCAWLKDRKNTKSHLQRAMEHEHFPIIMAETLETCFSEDMAPSLEQITHLFNLLTPYRSTEAHFKGITLYGSIIMRSRFAFNLILNSRIASDPVNRNILKHLLSDEFQEETFEFILENRGSFQ